MSEKQQIIRIISRNSDLAMWQAHYVAQKIEQIYPQFKVEINGITTKGDRLLDQSLDKVGGKGLFIKELEYDLIRQNSDIAIHSLKDLPANLDSNFTIAAILEREDARDAFISNKYPTIDSMPTNAVVGTSSLRRSALLRKYFPHLNIKLLRGNVLTRLKKLDDNQYDGIILAAAGLKRLGLEHLIKEYLALDKFIPAIGQGALAVEVLTSNLELQQLLAKLNHEPTFLAVNAERELGKILQASCSVPIAAHATISNAVLKLHAMVLDKETGKYCSSMIQDVKDNYLNIANKCANELLAQGVMQILQKYV